MRKLAPASDEESSDSSAAQLFWNMIPGEKRPQRLPDSLTRLVVVGFLLALSAACSLPASAPESDTGAPSETVSRQPTPERESTPQRTAESDETAPEATAASDPDSQFVPPPSNYRPPKVDPVAATVVSRIRTKEKLVFITIDDGGYLPSPTPAAKILKENNLPVTQFLVTSDIARDIDFYGKVSRRDQQTVQNHMVSHESLRAKSLVEQQQQICGANDDLERWYGERPWLMRPPFGEMNENTRRAAATCGIDYIVMWTVDTPNGTFKYSRGDQLRSGDIILFHWGPSTVWHLQQAIWRIKEQGFQVAALQDYLPRSSG